MEKSEKIISRQEDILRLSNVKLTEFEKIRLLRVMSSSFCDEMLRQSNWIPVHLRDDFMKEWSTIKSGVFKVLNIRFKEEKKNFKQQVNKPKSYKR